MTTINRINRLDESLRIIFLESSESCYEHVTGAILTNILTANYGIEMPVKKRAHMLTLLENALKSPSLGQLLLEASNETGVQDEILASNTGLPIKVIKDLKADTLYPNNVPIILFRKLLIMLNISYLAAESAVRKTFDSLQIKNNTSIHTSISPSFKKENFVSRELLQKNIFSTNGKELFQNEEALDRYLNKLNELMND